VLVTRYMLYLVVLSGVSTLYGCKTVYVPNVINVPLLSRKNEVRASINANNLQGSFAATDHIGVIVNGQYQSDSASSESTSAQTGSGGLVETGVGYFAPITSSLHAEIYGGAGYGHVRHKNWETTNGVRRDYRYSVSGAKFFLQPSVGFISDWFDIALSTRLVALRPFGASSENYPEAQLRNDKLFALDERLWGFVEPAVTIRAGYKMVKVFLQYGGSFKLNDAAISRDEKFVNIGLTGNFDLRP